MPRAGERDLIWDALTEHFGEVRTPSERGRRNRAVRELRIAQVSAEEIRIAVEFCARNFTTFTEVAVCNWLSRAIHEAGSTSNVREMFRQIEGGRA